MISVIIPTMWKAMEYTTQFLRALDDHPLVGEILLIDNDQTKKDDDLLKTITKLNYWTFEEKNIYVNPAWNFGAKNAKFDKLFIINDDVLVNLSQMEKLYDEITPDKGMIGFSYMSYCTYTLDAYDTLKNSGFGEDISLEIIDPRQYPKNSGMPHPFYGSAYFIHKESYFEIPKEFRIYYGDLYIYLCNLKKGNKNYVVEDGLVMTQYSSTVATSSFVREILVHESSIMKEILAEHGLRNIRYQIIS